MSMMVSYCAVFFPRDVLDGTYVSQCLRVFLPTLPFSLRILAVSMVHLFSKSLVSSEKEVSRTAYTTVRAFVNVYQSLPFCFEGGI